MLSLRHPGLLVLSYVKFVDAIQDLMHLLLANRPESQMAVVVTYVSCARLRTCSALAQIVSCQAQHCFVNECKNKKKLGHSSVSLHRGGQDEHHGEKFI